MGGVIEDEYGIAKEVNRLLRDRLPLRVVVDADLPPGAWYVVRGASPSERMDAKPHVLAQDMHAGLSRALAGKPDAMLHAREAAAAIKGGE